MLNSNTVLITPEILALISEIDEFKGTWRALGSVAPERLHRLRRVASIESIGSSTRIEGSRLSDKEVARLLSGVRTQGFASRDEQEVAGYAEVMELVFSSATEIRIDENHLWQLHRDLLIHSVKDERHRGNYKVTSNSVAAFDPDGNEIGIVFETASPFDTPLRMAELVAWNETATRSGVIHPLIRIAIFTVVFLEIHPFQDGNGRLSRILTALLLIQAGYSYVPYGSIESIVEENKERYYLALRETQATIRTESPDWQAWILFFLRTLREHKRRLLVKVERERLLQTSLPELSEKIMGYAREHGRITMGAILQLTGANRNTVKEHLRRLVLDRHLARHGTGRATWYTVV